MPEQPRNHEFLPFRGNLSDTGFETDPGKINRIDTSDQLVRISPLSEIQQDLKYRNLTISPEQYAQVGKRLLEELQQGYGVQVSPFSMVLVDNPKAPGESALYTTAKEVIGSSLLESLGNPESAPAQQDIDSLYSALALYFSNKYTQEGYYLDDIKNTHFMYGSVDNGKKDIYMVDLDCRFSFFDNQNSSASEKEEFFSRAAYLASMIREAEEKSGLQLHNAREGLLQFAKAVELTDPNSALVARFITKIRLRLDA